MKAAVLVLSLLAACSGPSVKKTGVETDAAKVAAVQARAEAAHGGGEAPAPATDALPVKTGSTMKTDDLAKGQAEERSGKVLGKDPVEGCTWVEGIANVVTGLQDTPHQARAAAIDQARAAAIQDFAGVTVKSKLMDFRQETLKDESRLTESMLQSTRNGLILKEEVLEQGYRDGADCSSCRYRARIKACVAAMPDDADKEFHVELSLNRTHFQHGDEAKVTFTATRDCWVYLYDVYDGGKGEQTALVAPNTLLKELRLKAGQEYSYPDEDARKAGIAALRAELPEGAERMSIETLRIIASKTPLPSKIYDPTEGGWLGVLQRLNRARAQWASDAEAFVISKR